ncbi:hypothetical protein B0H34DRAFT_683630 [Crassisporium funariophilum]|nr:hypothetical protein B0H34DRAFT_683630 [Crassisporium funariophilum]
MAFNAPSTSHMIPAWPPEAIPPVGYLSRKALPIKRNDAEPLTREDVQFDLLQYLFNDSNIVFTNPLSGKHPKMSFGDLYISALYNSSKCSKVLKEKMLETPLFSIEFAKISLLTNVGRINTTMAFFPEMKTALRTYHPVPSLQKTDGNAQDAPRIKNCLKAALLASELKAAPPSTPEEVLEKRRAGLKPPTSVVNLIFVLANHAAPLASVHFDGSLNFLDLFLPNKTKRLSSHDRGKAFLWLLYHYLESDTGPNPFDDYYSSKHPGKIPTLHRLTMHDYENENVDTQEEIQWGSQRSHERNIFLQKLVSSIETEKKNKAGAPHFVTVSAAPEMAPSSSRSQRTGQEQLKDERQFLHYVPSQESLPPRLENRAPHMHRSRASEGNERTMLQHAWHIANTTDALMDSDEEVADHHVRLDYSRRLSVITRIRRRPPTPP